MKRVMYWRVSLAIDFPRMFSCTSTTDARGNILRALSVNRPTTSDPLLEVWKLRERMRGF